MNEYKTWLENRYGVEVVAKIWVEIKRVERDFEYTSDFRAVLKDDKDGEKMYDDQRSCCGLEEWGFWVDDKLYFLGFDYGH